MDLVRQTRPLIFALASLILALLPVASWAGDIGEVNQAVGWRQILRADDAIEPEEGSVVASRDDLRTGDGRMEVVFGDDSKLRMTEHSRIVLDEVVIDNDPSKSSLAMTFAQGTARFVSGELGRIKKDNIRLKTPSSTISIRGTDFTVTVDELGRTLVVLLPSVDGLSSGEILVATQMGDVTLSRPYESTTTAVLEELPSTPAILDLTLDMLNNIMIISPPEQRQVKTDVYTGKETQTNINPLNIDFLDVVLLENDELSTEELEFREIDIDYLGVDYLEDLLDDYSDLSEETYEEIFGEADVALSGTNVGFDESTQINTIIDGSEVSIIRNVKNSLRIDTQVDAETVVRIEDGGRELNPVILNGESTVITIAH